MSQSVALGPISLEKYSYALSEQNVRHHVWHHNARREVLFLKVLRVESNVGAGFSDRGLEIVVTAGTESLERLDTQKLVSWAREHDQRLRQGLISSQTEPPVQVVVKFPCIAMRYPDNPPMVRRFQLKFGNEADYMTVRDLLRDLGFPIKESMGISRPDSRASTATSRASTNGLGLSSPAVPEWQRTSTASLTPASSGFGSSSLSHGHQSQASMSNRNETSSALSMRPPSILSPDIERLRSNSAMDSTRRHPSPFDNSVFQRPLPPRRVETPPTSSPSQLEYGQESRMQSSQALPVYMAPHLSRPASSTLGDYQPSQPQYTQSQDISAISGDTDARLSNFHGMGQPEGTQRRSYDAATSSQYFDEASRIKRSSTAQGSQAISMHGYEPLSQQRHHSYLHDSMHRPMSTPLTGSQYDMSRLDTSSWIPPRRDLPFPKAKESKKPEAPSPFVRQVSFSQDAAPQAPQQRPISPELQSAVFKTPPPAAKTPPPATAKPVKKRAPRKKTAVAASVAPPREIPDSEERVPRPASALPLEPVSPLASRAAAIPRPATAPPSKATQQARKRVAETVIAPPAKVSKMVDSSTQTQTGSGREHTALPRSLTVSQAPPADVVEVPAASMASRPLPTTTPQQAQRPIAQQTPAELDAVAEHMAVIVERYGQPERPQEIYELPGWDNATEDEKRDMVEDWMIEQLQDPKFIELCRVVEGMWQRTGIP